MAANPQQNPMTIQSQCECAYLLNKITQMIIVLTTVNQQNS